MNRSTALLGCALVVTSVACAQAPPPEADTPSEAPATVLTTESLESFAQAYESAVDERDPAAINRHFDLDTLIERALDGMDLSQDARAALAEGVRSDFDWGLSLARALGEEGHFKLLRARLEDDEGRVLFRLVNHEGGLNYHDAHVALAPDGAPRITDVHVYLSGETLSRTIRRSVEEAGAGTAAAHVIEVGRAIASMSAHIRAGEFADALNFYHTLPEAARDNKTVMIMRVTSAVQVGSQETTAACDAFRRLFPGDESLDLITFDELVYRERWDEALAAIERIGRAVGPDAWLDDLAASVHVEAGRNEEAKALLRRAMEREPTLEEPYWTMLGIALLEKDHATTAKYLGTLEQKFTYVFPELDSLAEYGDFVRSPEYGAWRASHVAAVP